MAENQKTILKPVTIKGNGLHSGLNVELTIKSAPVNHGYVFKRTDLKDQPLIRALAENVSTTDRGTSLQENDVNIGTVEHVLASLYGLGIDNALLELKGPEVPILDGSAKAFVEAILNAGIKEQDAERKYYELKEKISSGNNEKGLEIVAYPDENFSVNVNIDYNSKVLGHQYANLKNISDFEKEISQCRTFVFLHELEPLLKNNLIKGGDLDNAIVVVENKISKEEVDRLSKLFNKPKVDVKPEGILNNVELYFSNEPARHKLLDLIGDLALLGSRLKARIMAVKPGHYINTEFVKTLRKKIKNELSKPAPPEYDPNTPPLYDIRDVMLRLPHRPPFLLVDKILSMDKWTICGVKNTTMNEDFFIGHYPGNPIMPAVLQLEAMAQVGGILLMSLVPDPENYLLYFLKIENARFRYKVEPGDTLTIRMTLKEPVRRGLALTCGQGFVGDKLVVEADFMAQMVKKSENS
jgi:UDP-3-O-[3-hydroxymyristoyl] N-acetylglucosamine deacetylase/3-hydroxyacyl-[acyl-carrier-protein] dehydratase